MTRFFSFLGRTIDKVVGKRFLATTAYMIIEAFLRLNGINFSPETLAGLITFIVGQTASDMKIKKEKIDQILPLALAITAATFVGCARIAGVI